MNNKVVTFSGAHSERAELGGHEVGIGTDQHEKMQCAFLCTLLSRSASLWAPFPALPSSPVLLPSLSYQVCKPVSGDHTCQGDYLIHSVSHLANTSVSVSGERMIHTSYPR